MISVLVSFQVSLSRLMGLFFFGMHVGVAAWGGL